MCPAEAFRRQCSIFQPLLRHARRGSGLKRYLIKLFVRLPRARCIPCVRIFVLDTIKPRPSTLQSGACRRVADTVPRNARSRCAHRGAYSLVGHAYFPMSPNPMMLQRISRTPTAAACQPPPDVPQRAHQRVSASTPAAAVPPLAGSARCGPSAALAACVCAR